MRVPSIAVELLQCYRPLGLHPGLAPLPFGLRGEIFSRREQSAGTRVRFFLQDIIAASGSFDASGLVTCKLLPTAVVNGSDGSTASCEVPRPNGHWVREAAELYDMNTVAASTTSLNLCWGLFGVLPAHDWHSGISDGLCFEHSMEANDGDSCRRCTWLQQLGEWRFASYCSSMGPRLPTRPHAAQSRSP